MEGTITLTAAPAAATTQPRRAMQEETANQITHGIGFAMTVAGSFVLLQVAAGTGDMLRIVGCVVYSLSMMALYAASTLSHSFENEKLRNRWRMLDQACIFLFIAGNFTPFALVHLQDDAWWLLPVAIWVCALWGVRMRVRSGSRSIAARYFIAIGLLPLLCSAEILEAGHHLGLSLVVVGGAFYVLGTLFFLNDTRYPYFHAVWHVLVIVGGTCHYLFILYYVAQPLARV